MTGNMTHWIVNGVDSIDYLDNFFSADVNFNPYSTDFSTLEITSFHDDNMPKSIYTAKINNPADYNCYDRRGSMKVNYSYSGNKKKLIISSIDLACYTKNIFVAEDIEWEIIYLGKKPSDKRKIKTTYNGNTYEIQFN